MAFRYGVGFNFIAVMLAGVQSESLILYHAQIVEYRVIVMAPIDVAEVLDSRTFRGFRRELQ